MSDTAANRAADWFRPSRFAALLAFLVFASFPLVFAGSQTFVARDYGFFAYPLAHFQKECFWHGQIPFWDPYNNCGVPFLAQWNTMPLYPPVLIYLLLPLTWSLCFFCLLHLWFGGLGMYFLARKWTGNNFAAAFAGTAFAFNGLTLNLLMWPSHTATWSWMPWVVLAVESAWREGGRKLFLAAICGALQMLAGGPEIIFFTWLILLALWIQQLITNDFPRRMFWYFPAIIILFVLMSAVQLLPFLDLAAHSQRHAGYADLRWSMPARGWANFLVPMASGRIFGEGIFFQHDQFWTSSYYPGLATLWLALLAILQGRNRRVWLLAAFAIVAVVFALGANTPLFPAVRKFFPQFGFVTYPIKYLLIFAFATPLLAAFSLSRLSERKARGQVAIVGGILLILMAVALFLQWRYPLPYDEVRPALLNGLSRTVFLILFGAVLFILSRESETKIFKIATLALLVVAWLDVFTHEPAQNPTVPPAVYQLDFIRQQFAMNPQPELGGSRAMNTPKAYLQFIQMVLPEPQKNYLVKRLGFCGDCNLLDGVPKVDGFFSLTTHENDELITLIYGAKDDFPRLDDFLGVSQINAPDELYKWQSRATFLPLVTAGQKPVFLGPGETLRALTETNFDPRQVVYLPPDEQALVTVTNQTSARVLNSKFGLHNVEIEAQAAAPSLVVIAQTFYHDWSASVDGQTVPLLRANHAFQALQVPPGRHTIELVYKDRAFEGGLALSSLSWFVCLLSLFGACCMGRLNKKN